MTVKAVPIAHREEVKALDPIHIRRKNEGVLVLLEGVSWDVTYCGCKGELSYNIVPVIGLCGT
jgi:hypothetical protein